MTRSTDSAWLTARCLSERTMGRADAIYLLQGAGLLKRGTLGRARALLRVSVSDWEATKARHQDGAE